MVLVITGTDRSVISYKYKLFGDSRCCIRREMNDSVDVKRHMNLRTIAKLKVYAEFDLATLQQHINNTSTLVSGVGIQPSSQ